MHRDEVGFIPRMQRQFDIHKLVNEINPINNERLHINNKRKKHIILSIDKEKILTKANIH